MIHFTSWTRSSRREESKHSSTPISRVPFSLFKGIPFRRKNKQNDDVSTFVKAKNQCINPPNKPGARLLSLFSRSPNNPPPVPSKGLEPSWRAFSSTNEVAEYCNSPVNVGGRRTQDDDTPRLETGPSAVSFVALRSRWSCSTSSDNEEEASGSPQPGAVNQGDRDEEPASSRFGLPGQAKVKAIGDQRSISHRPNHSIATSTDSDRTVRPRHSMNSAVEPQTFRRGGPPPQRALPPRPSSKHMEVERKESQRVQPSSPGRSGNSAERAERQGIRTSPRYSAHYRSPGVVVNASSGRPFDIAETEGQLRFYAMVGSRQLYHATAMSARAYGYVVGSDHVLRRAPVSSNAVVSNA